MLDVPTFSIYKKDVLESSLFAPSVRDREMKIGYLPGNPPKMGAKLPETPGYYFE